MSDEARKRAEELIVKSYPSWPGLRADPPIIDAMLRFAEEYADGKLEEAAHRLFVYGYVQPAAEVRSYKSTPPKPPETRESVDEKLKRVLKELCSDGLAVHTAWMSGEKTDVSLRLDPRDNRALLGRIREIVQDHGDEGER